MVLDKYFAQASHGYQSVMIRQAMGDTASNMKVIAKFTTTIVHRLKDQFILTSLRFGQGLENLLPTQPRPSFVYVLNRSTDKPRRY